MSPKDEPPKSPPRLAPTRTSQSGSAPSRPSERFPARIGQMPDFETIEAAVRETARGKAFLDEYKRRCLEQENFKTGSAETQTILAAIGRLESVVKSQAIEMLQRQIEAKLNSRKSGDVSSVVHASALAEELAALAHKLKLRGQALDLAEKLLSIAQNLSQDPPFNLARDKPYSPSSTPASITPPDPVKPDVNAAACVQNKSSFDEALQANTSPHVSSPKAAAPSLAAPSLAAPSLAARVPRATIPPAAPPVKAKSPAFFLPAMEITNLEDETTTPQPFNHEPVFAQTQKLPATSPPDFMTLPSIQSLPSLAAAQEFSAQEFLEPEFLEPEFSQPEFSPPEFYQGAQETNAPLQDFPVSEPILELSQAAMRYDHAELAKAELAKAEFVMAQFDIQSLADVEKLSAEEQMALFC